MTNKFTNKFFVRFLLFDTFFLSETGFNVCIMTQETPPECIPASVYPQMNGIVGISNKHSTACEKEVDLP